MTCQRFLRKSVNSLSSQFKSASFCHIYPRKIVRDGDFLNLNCFGRFAARASRRYGHILWQTAKWRRTDGTGCTRSTSQYKAFVTNPYMHTLRPPAVVATRTSTVVPYRTSSGAVLPARHVRSATGYSARCPWRGVVCCADCRPRNPRPDHQSYSTVAGEGLTACTGMRVPVPVRESSKLYYGSTSNSTGTRTSTIMWLNAL